MHPLHELLVSTNDETVTAGLAIRAERLTSWIRATLDSVDSCKTAEGGHTDTIFLVH